ncbi:MAG: sterol desaturase family protein, partial [Minisyncoccia bacterium]
TLGPCIGVGLLVGLVMGYLFYIVVHDRIHHGNIREGSLLATLDANHEYHHRRFKANFGVTSPFWDHVFGTYQRPPTI